MAANNEVGTVQPLEAIGAACESRGVLFHSDLAQAAAYAPIDVNRLRLGLAAYPRTRRTVLRESARFTSGVAVREFDWPPCFSAADKSAVCVQVRSMSPSSSGSALHSLACVWFGQTTQHGSSLCATGCLLVFRQRLQILLLTAIRRSVCRTICRFPSAMLSRMH